MSIWKITYTDDDGLIQEMEVKADEDLEEKLESFVREKEKQSSVESTMPLRSPRKVAGAFK